MLILLLKLAGLTGKDQATETTEDKTRLRHLAWKESGEQGQGREERPWEILKGVWWVWNVRAVRYKGFEKIKVPLSLLLSCHQCSHLMHICVCIGVFKKEHCYSTDVIIENHRHETRNSRSRRGRNISQMNNKKLVKLIYFIISYSADSHFQGMRIWLHVASVSPWIK